MKKILAGILAAASMLSVSATAFATDKTVTKPGEVEYDVPVTAPTIVLNLILPSKMEAALNPYGADIKILTDDDTVTAKNGIVSTAYTITNKTKDYGVYIDAAATTTASEGIEVKAVTEQAGDNKKTASLAVIALATKPTGTTGYTTTTLSDKSATSDTALGVLTLDSTKADAKEQPKLVYLAASETGSTAYLAFAGELEKAEEWTEDDEINVNLILKVKAGPKAFA